MIFYPVMDFPSRIPDCGTLSPRRDRTKRHRLSRHRLVFLFFPDLFADVPLADQDPDDASILALDRDCILAHHIFLLSHCFDIPYRSSRLERPVNRRFVFLLSCTSDNTFLIG